MYGPESQNPEYGWRGFCMPEYTEEFKVKLVMKYLICDLEQFQVGHIKKQGLSQ